MSEEAQEPVKPATETTTVSEYDDIDDSPGESPAPAVPAEVRAAPPRDPVTGKFLPTQPSPSPSQVESPSPAVSPHLLRLAEDFGIPTEGLGEDALWASVRAVQRMVAPARRQDEVARAAEQQRQQAPGEPAAEPPYTIQGLKEDEYDPGFINPLKGALATLEQRVRALEGQLRGFAALERRRHDETAEQQIDRFFGELKDPRLGEGPLRKLSQDAPERKRRRAVCALAAERAVEKHGKAATTAQKIDELEAALKDLYGEAKPEPKPEPKAEPKNGPSPEEYARAALSRPTHRSGAPEPNGYAKAVQGVEDALRETRQESPTLDDEFPD